MITLPDRPRGVTSIIAAVACALAWCSSAFALNPELAISQYAHTTWKIRDGFTKGTINAIAQTPDGYLWLGTEFGLLRFDGVRSVPWQPPAGAHLPSEEIFNLLAARDGTLWIGTGKGLASWKGGVLTRYPELDGRFIFRLLEGRDGAMWVGGGGIANSALCNIAKGGMKCEGNPNQFGLGVFGLYEDSRGTLWVGSEKGLWRWRPGAQQFYSVPFDDSLDDLGEAADGTLVYGTRNGLRRLVDGKSEPYAGQMRTFYSRNRLRDRDGGLWVGTTQGLVHQHQGRTDRFTQSDGLSGDQVSTVLEDREGNVWVATVNGLDRFRESAVATFSVNQGAWAVNPGAVIAGGDGSVWLTTTTGGLSRWKTGQVLTYRAQGARPLTGTREIVGSGLPPGAHSLFQDGRGRIWVATRTGVGYLEDERFTTIAGTPSPTVRFIVGDSEGRTVWIGSQRFLFQVLDGRVAQQIPWDTLGRQDFATAAAVDSTGGLWLGFFSGGVAHFADGRLGERYESVDGLGSGRVNSVRLDRDGTLWVSAEGGLSRLSSGRISTLTRNTGLPCDLAQWTIEDDTRSLWLKMSCGLVRIARSELEAWITAVDRDTKATPMIRTTVLDSSDGVRISSTPSGYSPQMAKSRDGRLWFLPLDGVSVVDPRRLPFNSLPPPVHIEQLIADRQTHDVDAVGSAGLRLPALTRDLRIDYTALSLVAPEKVRFRYMLEGWDHDWQDVGNRRQAFYANLPPRTYRFRVIAANNSGVWNETGASLALSVDPAYYQATWFPVLCAGVVVGLVWAAHRLRVGILEKHQGEISALNERLMKAQEQERIRIAGELHDGVMQQMLAVTMMLGTAKRRTSDSGMKTSLDKIQEKLIQAGTDIRQLSHDLHPPILQEAGLPDAIRSYCEQFSASSGIAVACDADDRAHDLSRGAALALFRIVQEALGNAAKHAHARRVTVRLTRAGDDVSLTVSDDGAGFDANRLAASGGLGLVMMRERASQLNGTFHFESAPERGTTISVTIPFR